jgi:hypothetical protein
VRVEIVIVLVSRVEDVHGEAARVGVHPVGAVDECVICCTNVVDVDINL